MFQQKLAVVTAWVLFSCLAGLTIAQEEPRARGDQSTGERRLADPELEQRVAAWEKELKTLLDEVRSLRRAIQASRPQPETNNLTLSVMRLQKTNALDVARIVQQLLTEEEMKTVRVATPRTGNILILRGDPKTIDVVMGLIRRMEAETAEATATDDQVKP